MSLRFLKFRKRCIVLSEDTCSAGLAHTCDDGILSSSGGLLPSIEQSSRLEKALLKPLAWALR